MAYFDRVDVYEIEADLRVTNRAAEEGRRTKTAGSDAEIHDTQREIMGAIGERRNLARTSADPAEERRVNRDAATISDLCDRYLAEHVDIHNKPSTRKQVHLGPHQLRWPSGSLRRELVALR